MTDTIPLELTVPIQGISFSEKADENPCNGCSAPCCRILLFPHPTPNTFKDMDHIRYMLGFHNAEMVLNRDGQWQTLLNQTCRLLDQQTTLCTVHNTIRMPKICVFFNPHQCWYKRNFHNIKNPPDIIQIDMNVFEIILRHVKFNEEGNIIEIPTWEFIWDIVNNDQTPPSVDALSKSDELDDIKNTKAES